jgi:hypothetical protein
MVRRLTKPMMMVHELISPTSLSRRPHISMGNFHTNDDHARGAARRGSLPSFRPYIRAVAKLSKLDPRLLAIPRTLTLLQYERRTSDNRTPRFPCGTLDAGMQA